MFFQKFIKGICFDDDVQARVVLQQIGILCNWWRNIPGGGLPVGQIQGRLTQAELLMHLSHYHEPDPAHGYVPYGWNTPFISVTAGAVERDDSRGVNVVWPALMTALNFATDGFTKTGYLFYGYVHTLGRQSIELETFSEEVRELNIYASYLQYHPQGEVTAKIHIPSRCLERYEKYDPSLFPLPTRAPTPLAVVTNSSYAEPSNYANIRELVG